MRQAAAAWLANLPCHATTRFTTLTARDNQFAGVSTRLEPDDRGVVAAGAGST
jgi:hypothetical protein